MLLVAGREALEGGAGYLQGEMDLRPATLHYYLRNLRPFAA